jgi:hypothetical protein
MSGKRPYLMLMNNSYDDGSIMEPYFQRNLFYAVYPSGFEANQAANEVMYFSNPAWYERDRALFKKYIPLIRKLDEAGWEPVPFASVNPPTARIERYGSFEAGTLAFSVHNTSATDAEVTLTISRKELKLADDAAAKTWLSLRTIAPLVEGDAMRLTVHLAASGYDVVGIAKR